MHRISAPRGAMVTGVMGVIVLALVVLLRLCCCSPVNAGHTMPDGQSGVSDRPTVATALAASAPSDRHDVASAAPVAHCADSSSWDLSAPPVAFHDDAPMGVVVGVAPQISITARVAWSSWPGQRRGPPPTGVQRLRLKCVLQA